jgi:hypothetical protein
MNTITISENSAQGILVDGSQTPLGLTLPSGNCTLVFTVNMTDGSSPLGRKVTLDFIHKSTRKGAKDLKIVKNETGQWSYTCTQAASAEGEVSFSLNVPSPLPADLGLLAMLQDDAPYSEGMNSLTFSVSQSVVDHTGQVDKLVIVSGDKQFVQLGVAGKHYTALKVKATRAGAPVDGAKVTWEVKDTRGSSGTTIPSGPVFTTGGGLASATPVAGSKKGLLTVTATCNGHKVTFHLTVLPAWADLMLAPINLNAVLRSQATVGQHAVVKLVSRAIRSEYWADIPCHFAGVTGNKNDLVADIPLSINDPITSGPNGNLPEFTVRFASPPASGAQRGTLDYQAYLPGNPGTPVSATLILQVIAN